MRPALAVAALMTVALAQTLAASAAQPEEVAPHDDGVAAPALPPPARDADPLAVAAADDLGDLADDLAAADEPEPLPVAPTRFTPADTLAAIATASPRARCIVRTEVGGVGYDPYAIGRQGEKGVTQLHPRGLLTDFYAHGFDNPFNPYQEVAHLEGALRRGLASHWSGVKLGMC